MREANQDQIWSQVQEELRFQLAKRTYDMWRENTSAASAGGHAFFWFGGAWPGVVPGRDRISPGVQRRFPAQAGVSPRAGQVPNEVISSVAPARRGEFRHKYRTVDVLLIDDVQFLAGKDRTKEEFFHTFNALHEINKQIVISSDRPPKEIPTLEDRLRSRFEWGLIADIQSPDFETRLAILHSNLGDNSALIPEQGLNFIAHKVQRNIRALQSALTRA